MTKIAVAGGNDNHCLERALELQYHSEPGVEAEVNLAEVLPLYGVILLMQETSHEELEDLASELPTDTHLVAFYYPNGEAGCDAVRSYTASDIFDAYHDSGLRVISITNGYGRVKPKLWQDAKSTSTKKKS